uniref:Putative sugar transporter 5 n=1 Tax=Phaedon cochleariae TaxID=80249 RepID=W0FW00_PHACE|nr:putative sugar transporter 5 [Phaedon cochleariae]
MSNAYVIVLTGNIVNFVAGTVLTWSSPELDKLANDTETPFRYPIDEDERSWISSLFPLGSIFGPFIFGYLADVIGRKNTLLTCGVPFVVCYLLMAFGTEIWIFYLARFFLGVVLGGVFTVIPMYVGEVAEDTNRGALGSMMNVFLCSGLFFAYCVGPYTSVMVFNLILAVFAIIFLPTFYFLSPETPQYFISKGKYKEARESMQKIRGSTVNVDYELDAIQKKSKEDGKGNIMDIYRSKALTKALGISVGLVFFQQFSGINAVLFYAQTIFKKAGTSIKPEICSIIIGGVQFGTSFLTPLIADRLGRKVLLLVSAVGMVIAEVPLGIYCYLDSHGTNMSSVSFLPIVCLIAYIITYNFGFGPLPWAVMGEIFPANVKSIASSITAGFCWFCGFLIAKYFAAISDAIGMGPSFWIFSGFCAAAIPFTMFFVVETQGKNVDEIQKELDS